MKRFHRFPKRTRRLLAAAVTAWLAASPLSASAMTTEYVYHNGRPFLEMNFLEAGDGDTWIGKAEYPLSRTLMDATKSSAAYWSGILGDRAKNSQPWQVFVTTQKNEQNAAAGNVSFGLNEEGEWGSVAENFVARQIQDGKALNKETLELLRDEGEEAVGDCGFSLVTIGQHLGANREGAVDGWWLDADTVLPTNEQSTDFVATVRHELGHALGILPQIQYIDEEGNVLTDGEDHVYTAGRDPLVRIHAAVSNPNDWTLHLVDQNLNSAKPGMKIVTTAYFNELKAENPTLRESDFFIVDNPKLDKGLTGAKGYAYFVGDHVTEVLDGATFHGVNGLPVNGWESEDDKFDFEGSHLQTTGMMSHRRYSNYTSFMEAELAVMQDLGYDFDRKAYYGYSFYGDGGVITNTHGYFARNADGTAYLENTYSTVPLASVSTSTVRGTPSRRRRIS